MKEKLHYVVFCIFLFLTLLLIISGIRDLLPERFCMPAFFVYVGLGILAIWPFEKERSRIFREHDNLERASKEYKEKIDYLNEQKDYWYRRYREVVDSDEVQKVQARDP